MSEKGEKKRVGVFDSGIGGLHVLAACMRQLPEAQFYYYGDNAHAPYGSRPAEEIASFTGEALRFFADVKVDAAVIACNTASAVCLEEMRSRFCFPVVGMEPAVKQAVERCKNALVLATPRTAESARLKALIARFPNCRFTVVALPALAGAIENHLLKGEALSAPDHLPEIECDGVVLGCTHYAYLRQEIEAFYAAPVFDGAEGTAHRLKSVILAGRDDHFKPNQAVSAQKVIFLGKCAKMNKNLYKTNKCFKNI